MAFTNFDTKEINCKVLYVGPRGSGKTANLRSIYTNTAAEVKAGLMELDDQDGPTRFFDFLPVSIGQLKDFHVKLHLFTLPGNALYESTNTVLLKGVDGLVFIADSGMERMPDNIASMARARNLLSDAGINPSDIPMVIQYNKRDGADSIPVNILRQELNAGNVPDQEAIATRHVGTMETLQLMAKSVLRRLAFQEA